jgi:SPP1 gp7 family putative phage head morphogenesis protein
MTGTIELTPVPFEEALAYFRAKTDLPISFSYMDVRAEAHAVAFVVAKCMQLDLLRDIRQAIDDALAKGITQQQFNRQLIPLLQAAGWWGRQEMLDPKTGEMMSVQLGSLRRLQIIYETNLRTAYAAGHWQRIERAAEDRPWLRYVAVLDNRTRPQHRRLHGMVLRWDDSTWNSYFPPLGYRCRCRVQQYSDTDLAAYGHKPSDGAPYLGSPRPFYNERTGKTEIVPPGCDPGFGYNPGKVDRLEVARKLLDDKLTGWPHDIALAVRNEAADRLAQAAVLRHGYQTGNEAAVLVDRKTGAASPLLTSGLPDRVDLPADWKARIADPSEALVWHHNHPSNGSPSGEDVAQTAAPGVAEMAVHGQAGDDYRFRRGANWTGDAQTIGAIWDFAWWNGRDVLRPVVGPLVRAGALANDDGTWLLGWLTHSALSQAGVISGTATVNDAHRAVLEKLGDKLDSLERAVADLVSRRWSQSSTHAARKECHDQHSTL